MKISDIFYINQGHQITDEEIYTATGTIPILTANNEIKGYGKTSIVTSEFLPCLTYPSKAFTGEIFVQTELFDANNTAVLIPKEKYRTEMNLQYFAIAMGKLFLNYLSSESQVSYLSKETLSNIEITYPFPLLEEQNQVVIQYKKLERLKRDISRIIDNIKSLYSYELKLSKCITLPMAKIALLNKGSNKVSEEMIYKNNDPQGIPVYSSATENDGLMGKVTEEVYEKFHKQGHVGELTWTTNGYAGKVFFRDSKYLYSEKCGRIVVREQYLEKILPQYLCIILNQITYKYKTAESNNGKLDIIHMEKIPVDIPINDRGEVDVLTQKKVIELYQKIEAIEDSLELIRNEI